MHEFHVNEKNTLSDSMQKLDDDFQTVVYSKVKDHNRAERAKYPVEFQRPTNQLDETGINQLFHVSAKIREEGKYRMKNAGMPHNPVTPVIDIAFTTLDRGDTKMFGSKLLQLRPIYETCLRIKSESAIRAELSLNSKQEVKERFPQSFVWLLQVRKRVFE